MEITTAALTAGSNDCLLIRPGQIGENTAIFTFYQRSRRHLDNGILTVSAMHLLWLALAAVLSDDLAVITKIQQC